MRHTVPIHRDQLQLLLQRRQEFEAMRVRYVDIAHVLAAGAGLRNATLIEIDTDHATCTFESADPPNETDHGDPV